MLTTDWLINIAPLHSLFFSKSILRKLKVYLAVSNMTVKSPSCSSQEVFSQIQQKQEQCGEKGLGGLSEGLVYEICAVLLRSASHDQSKTVVILGNVEAEKNMFPQIKLMSFFFTKDAN